MLEERYWAQVGVAPCSMGGCERIIFARGWCSAHYARWRRHGDPRGGRGETMVERFWAKVERRGDDECWPWLAYCNDDGYGMFRYEGDPHMGRAHAAAWRITNGETGGLYVLHRCDNPPCCNPTHLFLGTQQDNIKDMHRKGRYRKRGQGSLR